MSVKTKNKCIVNDAWLSDFLSGLKEHTINCKHIAVFVKKVSIYQTRVLPVMRL